jgi:hypothetical protein
MDGDTPGEIEAVAIAEVVDNKLAPAGEVYSASARSARLA